VAPTILAMLWATLGFSANTTFMLFNQVGIHQGWQFQRYC
jgi:hypothetical protein